MRILRISVSAQVQVCLEVCDLEEARFIQYRPESLTWPLPAEFVVTEVKRDRGWFARVFSDLHEAHQMVQAARQEAKSTGRVPSAFVLNEKPPKPRAPKKKPECMVVDDLYGPVESASPDSCMFDVAETTARAVPAFPEDTCMFDVSATPKPVQDAPKDDGCLF